uniref:Putative replicase n=1 Tax=Batsystermes virus TaxID=2796578 RepID=A0A7T7GUU8_9VIRU|nr:putative replicase [Batsystermes virus]
MYMALDEAAEETQQDFPSNYKAGRAAPKSGKQEETSPQLHAALVESKRTQTLNGIVSELKREFGSRYDGRSEKRTRLWLDGDLQGSTLDARTPYFETGSKENKTWESREAISSRLWERIRAGHNLDPNTVRLLDALESSQKDKTGPLSVFLPWPKDGPEKVARVWCDKPMSSAINVSALRDAAAIVSSEILKPASYNRMASVDDAIGVERSVSSFVADEGMDRGTNSGLPYNKHRWYPSPVQQGDDLADSKQAYAYIRSRVAAALKAFSSGKTITWWAMAAKRLNVPWNPEDVMKHKRIVIALEKAEPIIGRMCTSQFIPKLRNVVWRESRVFVAQNDMPSIDIEMQKALESAHVSGVTLVGGDYSAFDASLPPWLIELAGQCLASMCPEASTVIMASVKSFIEGVRLVTANKIWYETPSSVKSGSGWTNIIDSVCNLLMLVYGECIGAYKLRGAYVQGDDFVVWGPDVTPDSVSGVAEQFKMQAHPTKQWYEPDSVVFLQKLHLRGMLGGMASVMRTLLQTLSYERMKYSERVWSVYTDAVRTRAQLENAAFSPFFEELVDYVKGGSRIHLGAGLSTGELVRKAGSDLVGELLLDNYGISHKQTGREDLLEALKVGAVSGVLAGESLPPVGSDARFSRVYGDRVGSIR